LFHKFTYEACVHCVNNNSIFIYYIFPEQFLKILSSFMAALSLNLPVTRTHTCSLHYKEIFNINI